MILGCYFLTVDNPEEENGKGKVFADYDEAIRALHAHAISYQTVIQVRLFGKRYETTVGRCIFNKEIWDGLKCHTIDPEAFINEIIGKKGLSELVYQWYIKFGSRVTADLCDRLKKIGFRYSTLSGISISIDDLTIPKKKAHILAEAQRSVEVLNKQMDSGEITSHDKTSQSNDIWRAATQRVSDALSNEMGRLNNVYIMANSGARGNMDQVRQLAGMRGLMSDSQGRTVDIPIRSNFKEGLSLTEYFISAYGARKGLVDTALRTADSGYLTRRLVDVAQDIMITIEDCGAIEGVDIKAITSGLNTLVELKDMLEGRISMEEIIDPATKAILVESGKIIFRHTAQAIQKSGILKVKTRSVFHCKAERGLCQNCYGMDLATVRMVSLGEAVGIIAAQSIGEPGTQLTMRTFHTGGVDLRKASRVELTAPQPGTVEFSEELVLSKVVIGGKENWIAVTDGTMTINNKEIKRQMIIPKGAEILVKPKSEVKKNEVLAAYDHMYQCGAVEEVGIVKLMDLESLEVNKDSKYKEFLARENGEIFVYDPKKSVECLVSESVAEKCVNGVRVTSDILQSDELKAGGLVVSVKKSDKKKVSESHIVTAYPGQSYPYIKGAIIFANDGDKVTINDILYRERLQDGDASKTQDIVQGLPRVEELFEARKPKEAAILAEVDGVVDVIHYDHYSVVSITPDEGKRKEYKLAKDTRLGVYAGKNVKKGDQLSDGRINPHDISITKGIVPTQEYLAEEVQRVYRSQGVSINSKHIDVIIRQMTRRITITEMGDSTLLLNEMIELKAFNKINTALVEEGKKPAKGDRLLLGITRASLSTDSFISASSFQQTASVLTKAALEGQSDPMTGLKENVIIGKLIPAGTGLKLYKHISIKSLNSEHEEKIEGLVAEAA